MSVRVWGRVAVTLTRVLLGLFPASFRRDVGTDMVRDVRRRAGELGGGLRGFVAGALWVVRLTASLLANAVAARREDRRRSALGSEQTRRDPRHAARPGGSFSWIDMKLGLRMLGRYPGLSLAGGLGIAVAIALSGGFFTFSHAYLHPTIPLPEGDRLVGLENWDVQYGDESRRSIHDFHLWRDELRSVEDLAAFEDATTALTRSDGSVEQVAVARMSPSGFTLARVPPLLGRAFVEGDAEPGAPPVVVIGYDVWRTRLAGDPNVIGRDLGLGAVPHEVVGVMPEGFAFPIEHDLWVPLRDRPDDHPLGDGPALFIAGRLADGYDLEAAQAELAVIGARMAERFPETHGRLRAQVMPYVLPLIDANEDAGADAVRDVRAMNLMLVLVLVVVCMNVSVLVYARTTMRLGEIAVRRALGASRTRIVGQLFVEVLVLCGVSAAAGLGLLRVGMRQAELLIETEIGRPFWADFGLSWTGVSYVLGLTLLAAVITGVLPGLRITGRDAREGLDRFSSRHGPRLGRAWTTLIVLQIGVAVVALPLASAWAWWEVRWSVTQPVYDVDRLLSFRLGRHGPDLRAEFGRRLDEDAGVVAHSFVNGFPIGFPARLGLEGPERDLGVDEVVSARLTVVGLDFFQTVGARVVAGRPFVAGDWDEGAWFVAVVDRAFADRYLGGRAAVGTRYRYATPDGPVEGGDDEPWLEIVGVIESLQENRFGPGLVEPRIYAPLSTTVAGSLGGLIRTGPDQVRVIERIRGHVRELDPELSATFSPVGVITRQQRQGFRLAALFVGLAVLAILVLSSAGVYAMMSFTVSRREREIGIRTALGAQPGVLVSEIFSRSIGRIAVGVAIGAVVVVGLDHAADGELLHGLGGRLVTGVVLLMGAVGIAATVGPARRGLGIAPAEALNAE